MTDPLGHPPMEAEFSWTHAPPSPHAETPELTREHGEDLRRQWPYQPPTAPVRSAHHTTPRAHRPTNDARGHARQPQRNIPVRGTNPPQFARASQNIAATTMLLRDLSEPNDPRGRVIH